MLQKEDIDLPKGSLVKIIDVRVGRIGDRNNVHGFLITDLDYLNKVTNKIDRFWSIGADTPGQRGCEKAKIPVGAVALYLGSMNMHDYRTHPQLLTYRIVLLEKAVYVLPSSSVEWLQPLTQTPE